MNNLNMNLIKFEIELLKSHYGANNVYWSSDLTWIMIKGFKLPSIYNKPFTNCLIIIPSGYGYGRKLEEFYLDQGLRVKQNGSYVSLPHYFEDNVHKGTSLADKNWHWLCIKPDSEQNDGIMMFLKQVYLFLEFPFETSMR